jgi:integrase/recombinase XerC/integrase/recombinase XerD
MTQNNVIRIDRRNVTDTDFTSAIDIFKTYCQSRNLSQNTISYYGYCLLAFTRYVDRNNPGLTLDDISTQTIRAFLLDQTQRNSASTACHCHTTLCVFFSFLVSDGFIECSPMGGVDKPKRRQAIINTFTLQQVEAILKTCGNDFLGLRDRAMIIIMIDCGLRVSELLGLCLDDVSWAEHTFRVIGKGNKERVVPFGNTTATTLTRYISRRGKLKASRVFVNCYGEPISRYSVRELIGRKGIKAGITGVRCSPHTFRHTFAVQYLRNGGDVFSLQKLLGHTDLSMTRKYAELSQTDVQEKHKLYSPADRLNASESQRKRLK